MAIDKVSALGLPGRAAAGGSGSGAAGRDATAGDAMGFERLLEGGAASTGPSRLEGSTAPSLAAPPGTSASARLGDRILGSLQSAGEQFSAAHQRATRALEGHGQFEVPALLQLQMELVDSTVRVELVSKLLSKASQELDQLTRLQ